MWQEWVLDEGGKSTLQYPPLQAYEQMKIWDVAGHQGENWLGFHQLNNIVGLLLLAVQYNIF